jgi:hypothetical protein
MLHAACSMPFSFAVAVAVPELQACCCCSGTASMLLLFRNCKHPFCRSGRTAELHACIPAELQACCCSIRNCKHPELHVLPLDAACNPAERDATMLRCNNSLIIFFIFSNVFCFAGLHAATCPFSYYIVNISVKHFNAFSLLVFNGYLLKCVNIFVHKSLCLYTLY